MNTMHTCKVTGWSQDLGFEVMLPASLYDMCPYIAFM